MIPERVVRALEAHGLRALEFEPGSTATAELAAARLGVTVGQIAKSLLFVTKDGRFYLLLCPGDRKASNAKLKAAVGGKLRMTRPEETRAATGFEAGGVCPSASTRRSASSSIRALPRTTGSTRPPAPPPPASP